MREATKVQFRGPSGAELGRLFERKYEDWDSVGWEPKLRKRFSYFTPDDYYEALVDSLVSKGAVWADIGCGRDIFPSNRGLARELTERASFVLGIDPDPNVRENPFLSQAVECVVDDYVPDRQYDIVTLRMVAEHIEDPQSAVDALSRMLKPGGVAVVYTPHKWAILSILARLTPLSVHHFFKRVLWDTEERDTFPVQFKMNTRRALARRFAQAGFSETHYDLVDDCRVFQHFFALHYIELSLQQLLKTIGLRYPDCCVFAMYRKA
jgi:2-polyprenyl-3-methyl-5-hydroxy-6-metoxy-1,4-benzoquinol methylase